jgi:CubicO group peptidase (beta-lactamase class C family)
MTTSSLGDVRLVAGHAAPLSLGLERGRPYTRVVDPRDAVRLTDTLVADGALPSAVLGISDAHGTRLIHAVRGPADRRVAADSVFFLASVTKPIVATAVLQLVDEGRLDLHRPITDLVPAFRGGLRDRVTPWHVLTHTSGIPDLALDQLRRSRPSYRALLARVCASEPAFEPGTRFCYASDSFYLLAEVLRELTGMGFQEALRARVLAPLGMHDTRFDIRPVRRRAVDVHGIPLRNPVIRMLIIRFLATATLPGGGLFGTAEDLLRFGRSLMPRTVAAPDAPRVLSQSAIELMTREHTTGILETLDDGTVREPHYALGWHKPRPAPDGGVTLAGVPLPATMAAFTHAGISGTRLWVDPEQRLVFVLLSNSWDLDQAHAAQVLATVYGGWSGS